MSLEQIFQTVNSTRYHEKLNRRLHAELSRRFSQWCRAESLDGESSEAAGRFLRAEIERGLDRLWLLDQRHDEFQHAWPMLTTDDERLEALLDHARQLGSDERHLKGDRRAAAGRWFGPDALADRWRKRKLETQRRLVDLFERWGLCLAELAANGDIGEAWNTLGGPALFARLATAELDPRVLRAALSAGATGFSAAPADRSLPAVDSKTLTLIGGWARDSQRDVWVQAEAHRLLALWSPGELADLLAERLQNPGADDDFFVRARLLHRLPELERRGMPQWHLLARVRRDPSEFVRQEACAVLTAGWAHVGWKWLREFALEDPSPRVRAAALASVRSTVGRADWRSTAVVDLLCDALAGEHDDFVVRVAAHVAGDWLTGVVDALAPAAPDDDPPELAPLCEQVRTRIVPVLARLRATADGIPLRRQLAMESERLWMLATPRIRNVVREIRAQWKNVPPGYARRFPKKFVEALGDDLGRALAVLAQNDYGYDLERGWFGWRLRRGERKKFRLWRALYELQTPSPDKRQAYDHTVGRRSRAELRAPSAIMSELSETKVPGEPLYMSHEGSWKPYLPLLDDVLSTVTGLSRGRPVRFFTSEGVTVLRPPRWIVRRWWAAARITLGFSKYAALRNWRRDSQHHPNEYAAALRRLGFELTFHPYEGESQPVVRDDSVERYFLPALVGASVLTEKLERFFGDLLSYFHSPYQSTTWHLILFVSGMALWFLGRHLYVNWAFRRQRNAIPLSIGGWGTRGKSGTERLKAALFCSLGYNVVSKSTGCEAMFMLSPPLGRLKEMFLFRPYDKATIWEQQDVVRLARDWGADVFLWECMGLTPAYVDVLQRQWMQDDIATITNTYPDHEDVQGPSGADVARTIAGFVPVRSTAVTTEREMRPLLEQTARNMHTRLESVGWMESGLIPRDILSRFSYEEHPDNIALVARLAGELGIPRDFALKAMADELVADLGVLKTFPPATIQTRTLEFTNGMSANERLGCLGNWERLGFDRQDPVAEPGVFVTTVVNNRADRVARSRVFAALIVNDLSADRHVLIGNNLKGMQGYIGDAWDRAVADVHIWPEEPGGSDPPAEQVVDEIFRRHRRPTEPKHVQDRLSIMLEAALPGSQQLSVRRSLLDEWHDGKALSERLRQLNVDEESARAVEEFHAESLTALDEYERISNRVKNAAPNQRSTVTQEFREMLRAWLPAKIVVVEDYHATGEQIVQRVAQATPPGFRNRVMGIQNIKGTGLDFVYRFQAWADCHSLCRRLLSGDSVDALAALRELSQFPDFGLLSEQCVLEAIAEAKASPPFADAQRQQELAALQDRVVRALAAVRESFAGHHHRGGWKEPLLNFVEQFLDLGDAVRRRRKAEQVYRDIMAERISLDRAAAILRDLTKRQKGGWLATGKDSGKERDDAMV